MCLCWGGRGGKWHLLAPLFLDKSFNDLCPSSTHSEMNKYIFLSYAPGGFQTAASNHVYIHAVYPLAVAYLFVCFGAAFLRAGTQFPLALLALPELSPLIFKVPGFKSLWLFKLMKFVPSDFQIKNLWRFLFP